MENDAVSVVPAWCIIYAWLPQHSKKVCRVQRVKSVILPILE